MVRKDATVLCSLALVSCLAASAPAGCKEFQERVKLDWYRNNLWPQPFVVTDRLATCAPFVTMVQNGWIQQSTLTSYHFNQNTHQLTEAGELKVRQIVTQQPENFRTVYVLQGPNEEVSSIRLDSVQQSAAKIVSKGPLPKIHFVNISPRGMPADEVHARSMKWHATIPPPRLPETSGSSVGSASN